MLYTIIILTIIKALTSQPLFSKKPSVVRIYTKGISPFETDVLLPYSIIQNIYEQQYKHHKREQGTLNTKIHAAMNPRSKVANKYRPNRFNNNFVPRKHIKGHIHFQRDSFNARIFNLYDDDGEYLLYLKYPENVVGPSEVKPFITNTFTMYVDDPHHLAKPGTKNLRSSKKLVQHVWINLK